MIVINLEVPLADRTYTVLVGDGARHELSTMLPAGVQRVAIVTQHSIGVDVGPDLPTDVEHQVFHIGEGESAKTLSTVEELCRGFAGFGMTRRDIVVAVGGGLVTDVGGFAASCYHRGIGVVHVSTTLLGQIDASIGGKTGVNLPEGKNLVGAFWQPSGVICDTELLATLPPREYTSGMGELAKYHFLGGGDLDALPLDERVAACVRIKADVVASDEREGGRRAVLNYGHTLAHALEIAGSFDLRHGEAVAVGLMYAAELAHVLGRIDEARVAEHRRVLGTYDLSPYLPEGTDHDAVIGLFARDKKALDGITFVLDGDNGVETVTGVDESHMREALVRISLPSAHTELRQGRI
ncbi:MAG: 5-deoxy-5-amino-3-dehydroquinate synthase [Candidatus Poriferisodalaceae bacterium]